MPWSYTALIALSAVVLIVWLLLARANRIDRLHRKVAASRAALDAQLRRRATAAVELASSGLVDPASSIVIADAAFSATDDDGPALTPVEALSMKGLGLDRERAESALSAALREALTDIDSLSVHGGDVRDQLLAAVAAAWYRAVVARRFHNEAVTQCILARRHWYVRVFRLAWHTPLPVAVDLDDAMPETLVAASTAVESRAAAGE